jgi:hypothetical protein
LAVGHDFCVKGLALFEPPLQVVGLADDDVEWKRRIDGEADSDRLVELVSARHDHQDIHIAVLVWRAVGIGPEQDDLVGLKALGDLASELPDQPHWDIGPTIPSGHRRLRGCVAFGDHEVILTQQGIFAP